MPDNPTQPPARFYGFARTRTGPDFFASTPDILREQEVPAQQPAPSTSTELVHVPRDERACTEVFAGGEAERGRQVGLPGRREAGLPGRRLVEPGRSIEPGISVQTVIEAIIAPPPEHRPKRAPRRIKKHTRRRQKKTRTRPPEPSRPMSRLARHQAHCGICGDELQEEIDEAFVNWECVYKIADEYEIDRRAIYRHAHATGLFAKRDRNLRGALGHIIHEADRVSPTADSIVRAVRMFAHINARGDWVNPPTHVMFSTATARPANAMPQRTDQVRGPEPSRGALPATPLSDTPCKVRKRLNP
jgi:hypothetical protein